MPNASLFLMQSILLLSISNSEERWFCDHCSSIRANKIKWGSLEGEENISNAISEAYSNVIKWRKNIFSLPRGKSGTCFIKELTRLVNLFVHKTKWERLALPLIHIFVPIMLQKPSAKSKAKEHTKYLTLRLEKWANGELDMLMSECKEIQKRLASAKARKAESNQKAFCRLMFLGKVGQACKFINNDDAVVGIHKLSDQIRQTLYDKHPKGEDQCPEVMLPITKVPPNPVIYEHITPEVVQSASKKLSGSGGPTLVDADSWKHFICSRAYGRHSYHLADAIAGMAKRFCSESIHPDCLQEYTAGRLIPLDKGIDSEGHPGVRPIGIGETLRRIVGKSVMGVLKNDVQVAGGCLQTCTGVRSGIEAAIHAMTEAWRLDSTEGLLQVDADNAFNRLNRKVALHNIKEVCPPIQAFLQNHYQRPAKLFATDASRQETILSDEGCTQGDTAAMGFYALGVKPLIDELDNCIQKEQCIQSWYADDSSAAGRLKQIKLWWTRLCQLGPKYGYFPKASKSILIIKDPSLLEEAQELFSGTGVKISYHGQRHLGATIGSESFKRRYVTSKITKWVDDIKDLAKIALAEPQAALSAYSKGICHRWTYIQRTISDISDLFHPLEECIKDVFIPALIGRQVSHVERIIFSLPVRLGGLGIANPVETADREYSASKRVTGNLSTLILQQNQDLSDYDNEAVDRIIKDVKTQKEAYLNEKLANLTSSIADAHMKRCLILNKEKGSGSWLTALPLKEHGYCLNKQEFRDAICLRYGWRIPNTPQFCGCGTKNSVDHTLICAKGGYVSMRHNALRDLNADLQREVCKDVVVEPRLLLLENEVVNGNSADRAAPDISSRGIWSTYERTFFDVRILHPNAPSYQSSTLSSLYARHEKEKMRSYNSRILTVEKGSFTPLVYTTFGGWAPQAVRYHKRLAELISVKQNEDYHHVINHIRTRVRFSLLRSVLIAVRGERGKRQRDLQPISSVSFNMIPEATSYECV